MQAQVTWIVGRAGQGQGQQSWLVPQGGMQIGAAYILELLRVPRGAHGANQRMLVQEETPAGEVERPSARPGSATQEVALASD